MPQPRRKSETRKVGGSPRGWATPAQNAGTAAREREREQVLKKATHRPSANLSGSRTPRTSPSSPQGQPAWASAPHGLITAGLWTSASVRRHCSDAARRAPEPEMVAFADARRPSTAHISHREPARKQRPSSAPFRGGHGGQTRELPAKGPTLAICRAMTGTWWRRAAARMMKAAI